MQSTGTPLDAIPPRVIWGVAMIGVGYLTGRVTRKLALFVGFLLAVVGLFAVIPSEHIPESAPGIKPLHETVISFPTGMGFLFLSGFLVGVSQK